MLVQNPGFSYHEYQEGGFALDTHWHRAYDDPFKRESVGRNKRDLSNVKHLCHVIDELFGS